MDFTSTPLFKAIYQKDLTAVIKLIMAKADLNKPDELGITPIQKAVMTGQLELVTLFICHGVDEDHSFNITRMVEDTPIFIAAQNGHLDIVKYLVEERNVNPFDKRYFKKRILFSPLKIAETNGHLHVVEYLKTLESNR